MSAPTHSRALADRWRQSKTVIGEAKAENRVLRDEVLRGNERLRELASSLLRKSGVN